MKMWFERFFLAILVAIAGGTLMTNPWKLDWFQRSTLLLSIVSLSLFIGRTIEKKTQEEPKFESPKPPPSIAETIAIADTMPKEILETPTPPPPEKPVKRSRPSQPRQNTLPLPELVVDDFSVVDQKLFSRMKLKNFGAVGAEVKIKVSSELSGVPMRIVAELPESVYLPTGATKTIEFSPLGDTDIEEILSAKKVYEISMEARFSIHGDEHGYHYRGRFDPTRRQFNLREEKRW